MTLLRTTLALFVLLLCGCSALSPSATPSGSTAAVSGKAGSIVGILVDPDNKPIANLGVFLADIKQSGDNNPGIIVFQPMSSPRGLTDDQGRFTIQNVAAGSYSLAVWTPNSSALVPQPGGASGSAVLAEVTAGKVNDLGTLKIERPR